MKKIMIFHAAENVLKRARELGYTIILVLSSDKKIDLSKYADYYKIIEYSNLDACLEYAKEMQIDGVISSSDTGVIVANYIAEQLDLPGLGFETAKLVKDKFRIQETLKSKDISVMPQSFLITDIEELATLKDIIHFPVIIKPNDGSGSVAVFNANTFDELEESCKIAIRNSVSKKAVIESYIAGEEYSSESFVYNNQVYNLALFHKIMTPPPNHTALYHILPSGLESTLKEKVDQTISSVIQALGITSGPVNTDIIITNTNEIYIVDIGARLGGHVLSSHLIPYYSGIDHIGNALRLAMGEDAIDLEEKPKKCVMSKVIELKEGVIQSLPDFKKYYDEYVLEITFRYKVGDVLPIYQSASQVPGFIIAGGTDDTDMQNRIEKIQNQIENDIVIE